MTTDRILLGVGLTLSFVPAGPATQAANAPPTRSD
jgi:hypothetical protein